ncbi:MAG TPA: Dyp-type peroxidase [Pyrinomonadaceae bacterium]|nr:Dyp-type peroxidase [Pyrinomonadaceae bacterium]
MAELEGKDMQGLLMSGYLHLSCANFMLLRITDGEAARRWLARLIERVTTGEGKQEGTSLNVAFTHRGLRNLGLDADTLDTFSRAFIEGMATPHRSRILGDAFENAPANWDWGGNDESKVIDVLLMLYAVDETTLEELLREQRANFTASGMIEVLSLGAGRQPDINEHFGFADGMGQPVIEGAPKSNEALPRNLIKAGEMLLGHINDYGKPADSPLVKPERDPQHLLDDASAFEVTPDAMTVMRDLGRNGTYLVFRQLAQNVADFWKFLDEATVGPDGQPDRAASTRLAAKLVGRWPSGAPLVMSPDEDNPALAKEDDFGYFESDARGFACPIGSHIRRSNPRDALGPDSATALASANRHRILRRGRSYGHRQPDPRVDDGVPRGLHFICLNGDIERQFEFVQQTWVNNPVFGGLHGEVDPIIGHLDKGDAIMTVQADPLRTRVHNMRRFVTVKGGAYFFLPSIKGLRYLASLGTAEESGVAGGVLGARPL